MKRFETYLNEGGFESRHIQVHSHGQMTWGTVGDAYEGYNYLVELDDDSLYWLIVGHHIEGERRYGPYMTREYAQRIAIVGDHAGAQRRVHRACGGRRDGRDGCGRQGRGARPVQGRGHRG